MKNKKHNIETLIQFDDNNIDHVLSGPDYGQPWGDWNGIEEPFEWYVESCELGIDIKTVLSKLN